MWKANIVLKILFIIAIAVTKYLTGSHTKMFYIQNYKNVSKEIKVDPKKEN